MDKAKTIERDIHELTVDLNNPLASGGQPPGIKGSLCDSEGYPR